MDSPIQLIGEPEEWELRLVDGSVIKVGAHGFREDDGDLLFVLFTTAAPDHALDVLRIPAGLVSETVRIK